MKESRVKLTKKLLQDSLLDLMKTKRIYKISIRETCEKAGVNRTTFYKYYNTEYDLLEEIENQYLQTIDEYISLSGKEAILEEILEFLLAHEDVFTLFLDNNQGNNFYERLIKMCFNKLAYNDKLQSIRQKYPSEHLYNFIIFGSLSIVKAWMGKLPSERESPLEMSNALYRIINTFFT